MTRAVILAAGRGTRLGPAGLDKPKCLIELCGRSLLDRQLAVLKACGIQEIALISGYKAEQLASRGHQVILNPRYAETNMVASLFCAEDWFKGGGDLIVAYGDIVYERRVLDALLASKDPVAVVVDRGWREYWQARFENPLSDAETLKINSEGYVTEVGKKPRGYEEIQAQYIGLFKICAADITRFAKAYHALDRNAVYDGKSFDLMYMTSLLQYLIDVGWLVRAVVADRGWLELDCESDMALYQQRNVSGESIGFCLDQEVNH